MIKPTLQIPRSSISALLRCVLIGTGFFSSARAEFPPLPQPATSFGAAIADGAIYVYGGNVGKAHEFHRDCIKGDFFRLNVTDTRSWETLASDTPLLGAPMTAFEGAIYRVGGLEARNPKGEKNDLHSNANVVRYVPATQRWEPLAPLPEARSSHDIAVLDSVLYVGGGWKLSGRDAGKENQGTWSESMLTLDLRAPDRGWQTHPQPFSRRALSAVTHGGRIWFLGGMDAHDEPSLEVDWFEPATKTWGKGPALPEGAMAGFGMAACSAAGKLLASPLSGKVLALSGDGLRWEEVAQLAKPRFFHRLLPIAENRVVAIGGSNRKGQINDLEVISLDAPAKSAPATVVKLPSEPAGSATWPQWRGPSRDGVSAETNWRKDWPFEGPAKIWSAQVGVGVSSCVVAAGRLITQGSDGLGAESVIALDAATGAELWRFSFPSKATAHEMPIVPNGPGATPTISGASVFALSREGDLLCLDVTSGQLAWRKNLAADLGGKRPVYGYAQSPLIEQGRLFLDIGCAPEKTGSTVALDAATGEVQWRAGSGEAGYSSARVLERDGRRLVAMLKGEALDLFDPADGKIVWSHRTTARDFCNSLTPVFVDHRILVSNTSEPQARLLDWDLGDAPNVRESWSSPQFALLFNNPIVQDGCLFAFNEKRRGHVEFTCLDAATGTPRWVSDAVPTGTFILADGHWIFLTREGEVVLAPATIAGLKPIARFKALDGKTYATPTLANGRLYVRDNAGNVAAFDLRKTDAVSSLAKKD